MSHAVGRESLFWFGEAAAVFLVELVGIGGLCGLGNDFDSLARCCLGVSDWKYWTCSQLERGDRQLGAGLPFDSEM